MYIFLSVLLKVPAGFNILFTQANYFSNSILTRFGTFGLIEPVQIAFAVSFAELRKMRININGKRVFWIDPGQDRKPAQHEAIMRIAKEYGDTVLPRPKEHMSKDGIHPTGKGYKLLADQTR